MGVSMILTTERLVVAAVAFGLLFFLQSRSRRVSDRILKNIQDQREKRIDGVIEEERLHDYDRFELHPMQIERFTQTPDTKTLSIIVSETVESEPLERRDQENE